jgi:hypothetical protein
MIKREDCDVEMLSLSDFEFDDSGEEEGMREKIAARDVVEKARVCWWSCEGLAGGRFNMPCQVTPAWMLQKQISVLSPELQLQFPQHGKIEVQIYTGSASSCSTSSFSNKPMLTKTEDAEYAITSSTTPSIHEDCITPRGEGDFAAEVRDDVGYTSPLGAGYGVDGEYDDYLEYLKPARSLERVRKEGATRKYSAIKMDVENGKMIEV